MCVSLSIYILLVLFLWRILTNTSANAVPWECCSGELLSHSVLWSGLHPLLQGCVPDPGLASESVAIPQS